jgi:ComF family protein
MRSVAYFEGPLQHALHRLKYKRDIILADSLASLLHAAWQTQALPGEGVVPVPLSSRRLRERGYNQAGLLARGFAELAGLRYMPDGVTRLRHTASQVGLTAEQRRANVAGAFEGRPRVVAGHAVILVDDVRTTGATLEACAEALRAAGAASVWGLTLARAR